MSVLRVCDRCGVEVTDRIGYLLGAPKLKGATIPVAAPYTAGSPSVPAQDFPTTVSFSFPQQDFCEPCARGALLAVAATLHIDGVDALSASVKAIQAAVQAAEEAAAVAAAVPVQVDPVLVQPVSSVGTVTP